SGKLPQLTVAIICCLPSLPVEVFGICALLSSVISAPTLRLGTGPLNSLPSWVKSQAIDDALTRACFHAGEIRVLDSSLCRVILHLGNRDDSCVTVSSSRDEVSFSSACTMKRFPSP